MKWVARLCSPVRGLLKLPTSHTLAGISLRKEFLHVWEEFNFVVHSFFPIFTDLLKELIAMDEKKFRDNIDVFDNIMKLADFSSYDT